MTDSDGSLIPPTPPTSPPLATPPMPPPDSAGVLADPLERQSDVHGWQLDPFHRHEGRYFAAGKATDLVRDGDHESIDPFIAPLDSSTMSSEPDASLVTARPSWLVPAAVAATVVIALVVVVGGWFLMRESNDHKYLAALKTHGMSGEFSSDPTAIAHAMQVCASLKSGGKQQGQPADEVAVGVYCPQFSNGFHVLETVSVEGSISFTDSSIYSSSISSYGGTCEGDGGYSDMSPGTGVTVKNGKGEIVATTELKSGTGSSYSCKMPFAFTVTEGEDTYVVSISHRGENSYSFDQLKFQGVNLHLG